MSRHNYHQLVVGGGDVLGGQACTLGGLNGSTGCGSVFEVTLSTGKESLVYRFNSAGSVTGDGINPLASLVEDTSTGLLYGTTVSGGVYEQGTVFSVSPSGSEVVLHSFGASPDGFFPDASLLDVGGTLYGTTSSGGNYYYSSSQGGLDVGGTVFALTL